MHWFVFSIFLCFAALLNGEAPLTWKHDSVFGSRCCDQSHSGENGTIDGQGDIWWNMWRQGTFQFTRPNLVEFMNSQSIIISNVVFMNSPFWNIHPVYCSNVVIHYGIAYNRPSTDITIRRVTGSSPFAGIAVGSETSGGVENILAEHINLSNMGVGIHLKTSVGRGGFIKKHWLCLVCSLV